MNKIDEIEAKFKKISPYPWHWSDEEVVSYVGKVVIVSKFVAQDPDMDFIAKSPERLVDLVEYTKAIEKWFAWAKKYRSGTIGYGIGWKEVHAADSMRTRQEASATKTQPLFH